MTSPTIPNGFTIGILGAGQLARMFALRAIQYGVRCRFYAQSKDDPACELGDYVVGHFSEKGKLIDFAHHCDLVTLENEFLTAETLKAVQLQSGTPIYPAPDAYSLIETKLKQKELMEKIDIPVVPYKQVHTWEDCLNFLNDHGSAVLKASFGGYDGYGNLDLNKDDEQAFINFKKNNPDLYVEAKVQLKKEWAVMIGCRGEQVVSYPACETVQKEHKCDYVLVERQGHEELRSKLKSFAEKIGAQLNTRGIFAFEFFETADGNLYFNESAPRPHNSHHYTQDAANIDQFQLLLLTLLNWKIPELEVGSDAVMGNLLGKTGDDFSLGSPELEGNVRIHLYAK